MRLSNSRAFALAAAGALALTMTACGSSEEESETASPTSEETEPAPEETTEEAPEETAAGGGECLIGTWGIGQEDIAAQTEQQLGTDVDVSVQGTNTIVFDESSMTQTADVTAEYSGTVEGAEIEGTDVTNGFYQLAYTLESDTSYVYGELIDADGSISSEGTFGGQPLDVELPYSEVATTFVGQTVEFDCSEDTLTLTLVDAGGIELNLIRQ